MRGRGYAPSAPRLAPPSVGVIEETLDSDLGLPPSVAAVEEMLDAELGVSGDPAVAASWVEL